MSIAKAPSLPNGYNPQLKVSKMLNWCLEKVKSVPYNVTMRWVFYQAVQEKGLTKSDYGNFKKWTSRARKSFWGGWKPNTLVDDTREISFRGGGYDSANEWIEAFKDKECLLDKRWTQNKIIIVCFEAQAMKSQFEHYTEDYYVSLVPFKGDASIEYKWRIAKAIEDFSRIYEKPIKILYFGDLDPKGEEIPENALRDIRAWSSVPFEYERIGLNEEHVEKWNLPENPDKFEYQWEALNDQAAKELIQGAIMKEIDLGALGDVIEQEAKATARWVEILDNLDLDEGNNDEPGPSEDD